ncbi:hypothetical protein PR048_032987 [Dryococelus australis]|uniref:Uncharacterized protein n=1 Tax=Dryococelus australis TaxID=614101 RepID=A0ABQ9G3T4_9NEOP|nr:hypothetical protein PR048_032987 [Dryococelus australis]
MKGAPCCRLRVISEELPSQQQPRRRSNSLPIPKIEVSMYQSPELKNKEPKDFIEVPEVKDVSYLISGEHCQVLIACFSVEYVRESANFHLSTKEHRSSSCEAGLHKFPHRSSDSFMISVCCGLQIVYGQAVEHATAEYV